MNNINLIFRECSNLLYLNLRSFISTNSNNLNYHEAFSSHPSNIKYCIEDLFIKNIIIPDKTNDCSDPCFQQNIIYDIEKGECINNENLKFEYNNNFY